MHVALGDASYDIMLGRGILPALPDLLSERCPAEHYVVITDSAVAPLYGERVSTLLEGSRCTVIPFPAGEWNKTRETWATLTDHMLAAGVGRDGAVIALGGGVVGDLAGFVAASYLRGIPYVQVPTTLLAMIDSSIGGKTGVDTPHGKNLVGAFHQPRVVVADMETISTLPPVHRSAGMAEALKHGVIADADYLTSLLERSEQILDAEPEALQLAVRRSVEIKAAVVAEDERERGRRAILNFGHTIGHAVEAVSGYGILHGEAVAMGMVAEAELGVRLGCTEASTRDRVREAIESFGLPSELDVEATAEKLVEIMTRDKKVRGGTVRFALPATVGTMAHGPEGEWTVPVSTHDIRDLFAQLQVPTQ